MSWPIVLFLALVASTQTRSAGYDPARDPGRDLEIAVKQAQQENKRILLVVGGEWCGWCHTLDTYIKTEADVHAAWSSGFVTLKVNFSPQNENRAFLGRYPAIQGYPHIFVLERDGKLLHSQDTSPLESGSSYSKEKLLQFISKWRPVR